MTTAMMNSTVAFDYTDMSTYAFVAAPPSSWTLQEAILFPLIFIIPAEILALLIDGVIWLTEYMCLPRLDGPAREDRPKLQWRDILYVAFNRTCVLPFVAWLNVTAIWNSNAVVWDMEQMTLFNTLVMGVVIFSLSDLVYYIGHRVVHHYPILYGFIHKHHHQEPIPIRGWFDTCNAHPTDFFYTGFSTSPVSVLWLMPLQSVHVAALAVVMYCVMFVGALGHSRLDFNIGVFNSRFHAGHHAMFNVNYAQNIELWDRIFGTFYKGDLFEDEVAETSKAK